MDDWVIWLIAAVIFGVGRDRHAGVLPRAVRGRGARGRRGGAAGGGAAFSLIAFLIVSVALLGALRPLARSHRAMPPRAAHRHGGAGRPRGAWSLERIHNDEGSGCVKLEGESWTARAYDEDAVFEPGKRVHVMEIRGATALVTE